MTTIVDVANKAGVSVATVSRIINKNTPVSEAKVAKVMAAIKALNFVPNYHAQNLTVNPQTGPGMIVQSIQDPLSASLLKDLSARASSLSQPLHLASGAHSEAQEIHLLENYLALGVQALYFESQHMDEQRLAEFMRLHPRLLVAKRYVSQFASQCLHLDLIASLWLAITSLVERGHSHITVCCDAQQYQEISPQLVNIDSPFSQATLTVNCLPHDPSDCISSVVGSDKCSALVCLSPRLSWPIWQQVQQQTEQLNRQIEFIGASNNAPGGKLSYSTLFYPVEAMARQALAFLFAEQAEVRGAFVAQLEACYSENELLYVSRLGAAG
ncbi:transcriptional regulator [Agarivorans sp. Toyoura001]|uniref:LacI family DNA-binding transcriptional regulator n=1 Tax=Agarivorans sp. Toyoura001 TaxID=2283141 RepID=UPI0010EDE2C8|nr:LacI family DNA-binding transcriptional regulator [Agarivorans sp. Toyoura001]GDY25128.1 transcriptional regulator [Agarivorans sp. Toyoura001]